MLCVRTAELYLDVEPRSKSEAGHLYARACKLGDKKACGQAEALSVKIEDEAPASAAAKEAPTPPPRRSRPAPATAASVAGASTPSTPARCSPAASAALPRAARMRDPRAAAAQLQRGGRNDDEPLRSPGVVHLVPVQEAIRLTRVSVSFDDDRPRRDQVRQGSGPLVRGLQRHGLRLHGRGRRLSLPVALGRAAGEHRSSRRPST